MAKLKGGTAAPSRLNGMAITPKYARAPLIYQHVIYQHALPNHRYQIEQPALLRNCRPVSGT